MATAISLVDCEAIHGTFRQWHSEHEPVAAELSESLAALAAYQSHLDAWHQQLAQAREELETARRQFELDRAAAEENQAQPFAETTAELNAPREKIAALTGALLARTEELRTLDNRRAELGTELELARAREKELKAALDEHKQSREQERAQWTDELRHTRELLQRQLEEAALEHHAAPPEQAHGTHQSQAVDVGNADHHAGSATDAADTPVLGSILQQFGKLRQQRALDRPGLKKAR